MKDDPLEIEMETYLHEALHYAEEWYFNLRGKASIGAWETPAEKQEKEKEITFREVADKFIQEYSVITEGQRSPAWARGHILPFLGDLPIKQVTGGKGGAKMGLWGAPGAA